MSCPQSNFGLSYFRMAGSSSVLVERVWSTDILVCCIVTIIVWVRYCICITYNAGGYTGFFARGVKLDWGRQESKVWHCIHIYIDV